MTTLEVRLFGTFTLERSGQPVARFPSRRVKDLLAYLLVTRPHRHPREHLAGLFWGDQDEHKARHCLNTALWRLQRVLGEPARGAHPYLHIDARSLGFNPASDVRLDIDEFEARCQLAERLAEHAAAQSVALYQEALVYYTGDLLVDCYDEWCLVERERLQRLYIRAQARLMSAYSANGAYDDATECGQAILAHDGLREEVHRDLIRVYLAAGRPSEALRQYRVCESLLRQELGVAPMPETQALLPRIVASIGPAAGPARAAPTPQPLIERQPTPPSDDSGAALAQIRAALADFDRARDRLQAALEALEGARPADGSLPLASLAAANGQTVAGD